MNGTNDGVQSSNISEIFAVIMVAENSTDVDIPYQINCRLMEPWLHIYAATLLLVSVVGTLENGIVLASMYRYRSLRTPSMVLVGVLACIDLAVSCSVIPMQVGTLFFH